MSFSDFPSQNLLLSLQAVFSGVADKSNRHAKADSTRRFLLLSCPSVVVLASLDALELPQVGGGEGQGVGVSPSESLSNPRIVQSLSVAELMVAKDSTHNSAKEDSGESESDVGVEGSGVQASALSVVPPAEACTETN
jgi:hypothetical protein